MRHLLPLTICSLAVLGLGAVAVHDHHAAVHQLTVQNARAAAQQAKAAVRAELAAHQQAEATQAKLSGLEKSCQNGLAAYNLLTSSQQKRVTKPDCSA